MSAKYRWLVGSKESLRQARLCIEADLVIAAISLEKSKLILFEVDAFQHDFS